MVIKFYWYQCRVSSRGRKKKKAYLTVKHGGIPFVRIGQSLLIYWVAAQPGPNGHTLKAGQKSWSYSFPLSESHCICDYCLPSTVSCAHHCIINTMNHIKIFLNRLSSKEFMVLCKIDRSTCVKNERKKRLSHLWTLTKCCFTALNGISRVGGLLNSDPYFLVKNWLLPLERKALL